MIVALAGGVGAARMLRALSMVTDPGGITAVVNTGDDTVLHGLAISPDLDTVTYTLSGRINNETGWGLSGETWQAMDSLKSLDPGGTLGWFNLGDKDLGTHMYRTSRLAQGATLSQVTAEITAAYGVGVRLIPMSDQRVETRLVVQGDPGKGLEPGTEIGFQEYFVKYQHSVAVGQVVLRGADQARPAPGVIEAIESAEAIVICPSNPIVSIGPILAVAGIREALEARRDQVLAISPIIAGKALKGPADRLMTELGEESSVVGVARTYRPIASTLVIDEADADSAEQVRGAGMEPVVTPTVMSDDRVSASLGLTVLRSAGLAA